MTIQIVVLILIVALLGYIVLLHIQLAKKNIFIETTVKRLSGIEKSRSMDEMMAFLLEIQKLSQYTSFFTDKLLEDSTINFILENDKDLKIYMHYTKDVADAKSILKDGFKFVDSFYKTALPVSKDKLDLIIKHNSRKFFGEYLIIICISSDIVNYYSMELEKAGIKNYSFENILTEAPPAVNDNSELVYQLPSQYIKGYINLRTGEIVKNPGFDPYYNPPCFIKNFDLLKNK
ncbi:MAG: hypothetical protein NT144_05985 [Bacteroidia bacterium]|nr:hypothetical protein [Bacteroidia bacterium]